MSNDLVVGSIRSTVTPPITGGIYEALLDKANKDNAELADRLSGLELRSTQQLAELEKENEEQARLLGMGSEREARLITERDHYKHALESLSSSTKKWANSHVPANQSLDFIKRISAYIEKQLNQP